MANLKEIRERLSSIVGTRQITSAMKMVSAAKLRKAQDEVVKMRPYADKLHEILTNLSSSLDSGDDNPYSQVREVKKVLVVLITSNRGLCGGFNSHAIKKAISVANEQYPDLAKNGNVEFYTLGKKGNDAILKQGFKVYKYNTAIYDALTYENVGPIAQELMDIYASKEFDKIDIVYNQFKNAASQNLLQEAYLPVTVEESESNFSADYIFEPNKEDIVNDLIPRSLRIQVFKALLDSYASEHGARMTAMHKATENADELSNDLRLQYNKARQASITTEILEVVGGAEALNG